MGLQFQRDEWRVSASNIHAMYEFLTIAKLEIDAANSQLYDVFQCT